MKIKNLSASRRIKIKITFVLLTLFFYFLLFTFNFGFAEGETMSNPDYILRSGNLNMSAGESSNTNYKTSFTAGQTSPGLYEGQNYIAKMGFQYLGSGKTFSFSISETLIDFGILSPTNPVTRINILSVNNTSTPGYSVTASENHPLRSQASGATIPDTTCDNGNCSEINSRLWINTLTYGFGYRCDPVSATNYCSLSFSQIDYFRQFADSSNSETAQVVFSNSSGSNQQAKITYKINISGSQQTGIYNNNLIYIATPSF